MNREFGLESDKPKRKAPLNNFDNDELLSLELDTH